MSSNSTPISPARFAAALSDLSLPNLHAKAAEIYNSLGHLRASNAQLAEFADPNAPSYDHVCEESIRENEQVMGRMNERLDLLRTEVEGRGSRWVWDDLEQKEDAAMELMRRSNAENSQTESHVAVNGTTHQEAPAERSVQEPAANPQSVQEASSDGTRQAAQGQQQSGRLTDEELARRMAERMADEPGGDADSEGDGMYL